MGRRQREIGARGKVVMVGRDIGTVILPDAELKIYLDASVEARARRRTDEMLARGESANYEAILASMRERDRIDSTRAHAPLRPAPDAVVIDSTDLTIEQVVERAVQLLDRRPSTLEASLRLPGRVRAFRAAARPIFRLLFHILCSVRIEGMENVPRRGGYLVSANHLSIIDPPFIVAFWPRPLETAGAVEILERPFQGQLMRWYGGVPVRRGEADRAMLAELVRRLRAGYPVYMDPEGRRSHKPGMQDAHPGVAYLAARAGVPVVPVGITGAEAATAAWRRLRRGRLTMKVGRPVHLPAVNLRSSSRKGALRSNTERLMHAIAELLPEEYRGMYR
jgi:1-acyl-sn-glycerol-3-phosphate acyltransferase